MTPDNHNTQLFAMGDLLINPVECGHGRHNFIVQNQDLAIQLAEAFDCGIIDNPADWDLYN